MWPPAKSLRVLEVGRVDQKLFAASHTSKGTITAMWLLQKIFHHLALASCRARAKFAATVRQKQSFEAPRRIESLGYDETDLSADCLGGLYYVTLISPYGVTHFMKYFFVYVWPLQIW